METTDSNKISDNDEILKKEVETILLSKTPPTASQVEEVKVKYPERIWRAYIGYCVQGK